ncbi:DUF4180 domain-containing protein [Paenibacillus hodogayensis]|uniref:DUF4180 domain-containing protein n=1 Tax=Paenibacillus hodogayensis TaxID=279208 RepID=A0ABV5VZT2_9BACL
MNYTIIDRNGKTYVAADSTSPLATEQDALDLVGACMGHDALRLLLGEGTLSDDFFKLRTGLAGSVLQKFVNYRIRAAAVIPDGQLIQGRAKEMIAEMKHGNDFQVFATVEEAEQWLLGF